MRGHEAGWARSHSIPPANVYYSGFFTSFDLRQTCAGSTGTRRTPPTSSVHSPTSDGRGTRHSEGAPFFRHKNDTLPTQLGQRQSFTFQNRQTRSGRFSVQGIVHAPFWGCGLMHDGSTTDYFWRQRAFCVNLQSGAFSPRTPSPLPCISVCSYMYCMGHRYDNNGCSRWRRRTVVPRSPTSNGSWRGIVGLEGAKPRTADHQFTFAHRSDGTILTSIR